VELPGSIIVDVLEPPTLPATTNLADALTFVFENPVGSPPLRKILPPSGEVAIVVSDKTRPCAYPVVLPFLLDFLNAHGVPDSRIFILVAYGAHPCHTDDESRAFYGEEAVRRVRFFHHDCRDEDKLVPLGTTSRGTPVCLNRRYVEAAMSIVLTSVSFHYFAGFGGGRKAVFPGLASEEGILANHRIFVESAGPSLSKIRDFQGNLDDNPLSDDLVEAAGMAPPSFAVNFCLNHDGEVCRVFAGHWLDSHRRACRFLSGTCLPLERQYDLVIASCGGHPKDINFIQCHKTIDNAFDFVRPGGFLLVLGRCEEGIGSESFLDWFEHRNSGSMRKALLQKYSMNGGTALSMKFKAERCRIFLCSSLESAVVKKMGMHAVPDIQRGLREVLGSRDIRLAAILPEGASTVAKRGFGASDSG